MSHGSAALQLRPLLETDANAISKAFAALGIEKPARRYSDYFSEQQVGIRDCWLAWLGSELAGYITLHWNPLYPGVAGKGVPEIQDVNVLAPFRQRGIASRLLELAEQSAEPRAAAVAIAVGLHPGYNAAQRLYVRRGYVPDGLGVTHDDRYVQEGELVPFDDQLMLHLIKILR
jgi:GNAT superfamily N-acetyltransferase